MDERKERGMEHAVTQDARKVKAATEKVPQEKEPERDREEGRLNVHHKTT